MSKPRLELKLPADDLFDDRLPENEMRRRWARLEHAREQRATPGKQGRLFVATAACTAVCVAALFVGLLVLLKERGPLRLVDGRDVPATLVSEAASVVRLDDGSSLELSPGTRLDVLESTKGRFALALRRGATEFEVHPGGPRTWSIECAGVVVEVVGTHFTVVRAPESLRVTVQRGTVLVRGEAVPDQVVRLNAGQWIVVPLPVPVAEASPRSTAGAEPAPEVEPSVKHRSTDAAGNAPVEPSKPSMPALPSDTGPPGSASQVPIASHATFDPPDPMGNGVDAMDAQMANADALRRAGRFREAAALLEGALAARRTDARASLVEFSLGRLYLESLADPASAARHFARALAGHLPSALAEDARAGVVEAFARKGDRNAAANAAALYRAQYPGGRHSTNVERWASGSF